MRDTNLTKQTIILATVFCAFAVAVALGIDTDQIRMPKDGFTVQDIRFDPSKAEVIEGISQSVNTSRRSQNLVVTEFGIAGALDEPPYEYTLVESDAERPPIHHYRLNDAVTRTTNTMTIKDEGIGRVGVGNVDLTASVVADTWTTTGLVSEGFDGTKYHARTVSASAPPSGPLTLSAWFRVPDEAALQALSTNYYDNQIFGYTRGSLSGIYFSIYKYGEGFHIQGEFSSRDYYPVPNEDTYKWHHVVYVYDNVAVDYAPYKAYINGSLQMEGTKQDIIDPVYLNIASRWDDPKLSAVVDDARIYDYALSAAQVSRLYNEGLGTEQSITTGTQVLRDSIIYDSGGRTYVGTAMPGGAGEIQFATSATTRAVLDNDALTMSVPIVGDLTGDVTGNLTGHADTATTATVALTSADYTTPTLANVIEQDNDAGLQDVIGLRNVTSRYLSLLTSGTAMQFDATYLQSLQRTRLNTLEQPYPVTIEHAETSALNPHGRALEAQHGDIAVLDGGLTVSDGIEATTATIGAVSATTVTAPTLIGDLTGHADTATTADVALDWPGYTTPPLATVLDAGSDAGGQSLTGVGNLTTTGTVSAQTVTAAGTISGTTGNLTTVNATIVNAGAGGVLSEGDISSDAGLVAGTDATVGRTLYLPGQAAGSLDGAIYRDGVPFIHTYVGTGDTATPVGRNLFIGEGAGGALLSGNDATETYHGSYNTAQGYQALYSNTTGRYNTAQGYQALLYNTTGSYNTAQGHNALLYNTTGRYNNAQGYQALRDNTTGSHNTAQGYQALYNTTGSYNTAQGYQALLYNTTGSYNTAQGHYAGRYFDTGTSPLTVTNDSIYLGVNTRSAYDGVTNQIVIGNGALGLGNNSVVLGNDDIEITALKGYVGIGTTAPTDALEVVGNGVFSGSVSAAGFLDTTPGWSLSSADALDAVLGIRYETASAVKDGGATVTKLDHDSLPEFARIVHSVQQVPTGKTITRTREVEVVEAEDDGTTHTAIRIFEDEIPETVPVERVGRDLGAMVTVLTEAVKELEARNAALEARIRALEPTPTPTPIGEVRE